jgi:hypothetical protein
MLPLEFTDVEEKPRPSRKKTLIQEGTAEPAKPGAATSAATASAIQLPAGLATGATGPATAKVFFRLLFFALFDGARRKLLDVLRPDFKGG